MLKLFANTFLVPSAEVIEEALILLTNESAYCFVHASLRFVGVPSPVILYPAIAKLLFGVVIEFNGTVFK